MKLIAALFISAMLISSASACPINVERLVWAIGRAENSQSHPYGIIALHRLSQSDAKAWCRNTVNHRLNVWKASGSHGGFIRYLGGFYSPLNAANDPRGLNSNWVRNVKFYYYERLHKIGSR